MTLVSLKLVNKQGKQNLKNKNKPQESGGAQKKGEKFHPCYHIIVPYLKNLCHTQSPSMKSNNSV